MQRQTDEGQRQSQEARREGAHKVGKRCGDGGTGRQRDRSETQRNRQKLRQREKELTREGREKPEKQEDVGN